MNCNVCIVCKNGKLQQQQQKQDSHFMQNDFLRWKYIIKNVQSRTTVNIRYTIHRMKTNKTKTTTPKTKKMSQFLVCVHTLKNI